MAGITAVYALKAMKKFIEKNVASEMWLAEEKANPVRYVHPYVSLITVPHKNFIPVNFQVPHILVGLVQGNESADEGHLTIRIACATYTSDTKFEDDGNIPDDTGYIELLNLLERIKHKLIQEAVIEGTFGIDRDNMQYGIYDEELTYPYWYGYLTFNINIPTTQRQFKIEELI